MQSVYGLLLRERVEVNKPHAKGPKIRKEPSAPRVRKGTNLPTAS
jgi:hypothetical protein